MTAEHILKEIVALSLVEKEKLAIMLNDHPEILAQSTEDQIEQAHQAMLSKFDKSFEKLSQ